MKSNHFFAQLSKHLLLVSIALNFTSANIPLSPEPEIFAGSTPCNPVMRPLLAIPADMDCEFVKWNLLLFKNPENHSLNSFKLNVTFGIAKGGTQGFTDASKSSEFKGKWSVRKNTGKLPGESVIGLESTGQKQIISFLKLDENLLHLLDSEEKLMIGNAAWSYTLNRTRK